MTEHEPGLWATISTWWVQSPGIAGAVMSALISILRVLYDGKERRLVRMGLESIICGCLTLSCYGIMRLMGWPDALVVTIGGAVGFIGVDQLRAIVVKRLKRI